jgi:O-antigen ligase
MLLGTFEASIAILQYMLQSPCGLEMLGELHPNHFCFAKEGTTIHLFGKTATGPLMRAAGTFLHPNILGCFLFASSLSTLYLKRTSGFLVLFFLQWMGLFATFSRSALLATAIAFPLFLALLAYKKMIPRYLFIKLGTLFVCLVLIFLPALKSRGGIFSYEGTVKAADQERIHYNKIALNLLQEHPWFGVGHNNFQLYSSYTDPSMPGHTFFSKVHNIYLLVASETGLLGLGCFLFFLFQLFFPLAQNWTLERIFLFSLFLGLLLIGGCDFFLLYSAPACVLFFSTASLLFLSKQRSFL